MLLCQAAAIPPEEQDVIVGACTRTFGFAPKDFQLQAVWSLLNGKNAAVVQPTG